MATITPTQTSLRPNVLDIVWATQTQADTATAVEILGFDRGAVQIGGTFGGSTVTLQGSNDNSTFATLDDVAGGAVSATAAAIFDVNCNCRYIRPLVTGGTAESLTIKVILRG